MAATFNVTLDTGGSDNTPGTSATITNLRFNAEDTNDQDVASPITITASSTIYSYWKQLYLKCSGAPDTQADTVKIYSDGSLAWTGVTVNIGDELPVHNSGATTGYDVADAQETQVNHTDITAVTSLFTYTSGSAKSVTISESGSIINATNETTNYIVLQAAVTDTATSGTKATETVTWSYVEI